MDENLLTIEDMAKIFVCSSESIRRWCAAGIIPKPIRVGRRAIRFRESDSRCFLDRQSDANSAGDKIQHPTEVLR